MNHQYLYTYRITGETAIRNIRASETLDTEAISRALQGRHGAEPMFVSLVRTATATDANVPSLSEGEGGSNDADPYGWARAYDLAAISECKADKPSIAASWDAAFKQAQAGN